MARRLDLIKDFLSQCKGTIFCLTDKFMSLKIIFKIYALLSFTGQL